MSDIVIKHFEGKAVRFRQEGEKLLMSMKEIGQVLAYQHPDRSISNLYSAHKDEFDNDCTELHYIEGMGGPPQRERLFTLDGLILICMFSEQPVAKKVRRWLRKIGREVAVTGSYSSPVLTRILDRMNETLLIQGKMVTNLAAEVHELREWRAAAFIPAPKDNSFWPTPTQLLKQCINPKRIPKRFNSGGSFDWAASERHAMLRDGPLSIRDRRSIGKRSDVVIEDCPENRQFVRETFSVYLQTRWNQGTLKLLPMKQEVAQQ